MSKAHRSGDTPSPTLPATHEIIFVARTRAVCDGGTGALGHPRVYLEMGDDTQIQCPYCSRLYVLEGHEPKPVVKLAG